MFEALKVPGETKKKFVEVQGEYPRLPLSQIADAVVDGWSLLTAEQRDACIRGQAGERRREAVSA